MACLVMPDPEAMACERSERNFLTLRMQVPYFPWRCFKSITSQAGTLLCQKWKILMCSLLTLRNHLICLENTNFLASINKWGLFVQKLDLSVKLPTVSAFAYMYNFTKEDSFLRQIAVYEICTVMTLSRIFHMVFHSDFLPYTAFEKW